ncbi:MAG: D-alanine--D-alanine ligase [Bacteroidales bacterium]|jgi:D-alanine-D-alanine ligase|nr:D-alanine--D-alanine ligase [Bacteroidales bacterium]
MAQIKNIALVCGGYSKEYDVSIRSAAEVAKQIDTKKYNLYKIVIDKNKWYYLPDGCEPLAADTTSVVQPCAVVDKNDFSITLTGEHIRFDMAFIIIHGTPGEDGLLQGYFDMLRIPYNTCNACVSAITFNKAYCNAVLAHNGVRVAPSVRLFKDIAFNEAEVLNVVGLPCFVKPNAGGSSVGVTKVKRSEDLSAAIARAFDEDNEILIEKFIAGREYSCGLINDKVLPLTEIISETEFFDYEAKYEGKSKEVTPAEAPVALTAEIAEISRRVYDILHCFGVVRCDYIVEEKTGQVFFLEVNTVPGQSAQSIVPQQVRAAGKTLKEFYQSIIDECRLNP